MQYQIDLPAVDQITEQELNQSKTMLDKMSVSQLFFDQNTFSHIGKVVTKCRAITESMKGYFRQNICRLNGF
jgi:hypothetical protein